MVIPGVATRKVAFAVGALPVFQQAGRGFGHAQVAALAPQRDAGAHLVDKVVFLDPVLRPLGFKGKLARVLFLGARDRDKVGTHSTGFDNLVCDALVCETKVPRWFQIGRVEDWVFDDNLRHYIISFCYGGD
jgi:hypothetical protein